MGARDSGFNKQVAEEAAAWFVDFSVGDVEPDQLASFNEWLRTSPIHVRAYLQVAALWEDAELLKLDAAELEALARQIASEGNVIPLRQAEARTPVVVPNAVPNVSVPPPQIPARRVGRRFAVAACVSLLSAIIGFAVWTRVDRGLTYVTETGEQRSITLADGSVVQLNSQSRLRVSFSEQVRTVELIDGQALFEVAKNPARPFVVVSGKTRVRAVGTQFDVYRKSAGTVVTVLEGRVAVSGDTARVSTPALLSAGEQIVVTPTAILPPQPTNVEATVAWTQKKLMFDAAPLSEVAAEFNRYSRQRLILDDAALDEIRISGVFASSGVDYLVQFLQQRFDVTATTADGQIHLSRRPRSDTP
ncbi:FecR family protein [Peristeroidobacter soli]|jgi:transmembrane sensor|uniref:FecR family protein n=1 Tax=Peristeroidobacter soli TaxID=2497877 RepID=UPI00101B77BC|nr:FecR domain-containing protein [Peristeroidobacter soli]